jgi:hypothetical protein
MENIFNGFCSLAQNNPRIQLKTSPHIALVRLVRLYIVGLGDIRPVCFAYVYAIRIIVYLDEPLVESFCLFNQLYQLLISHSFEWVYFLMLRWGQPMSLSNWVSNGPIVHPPDDT